MKLEKIKIIAPDAEITHNESFPIAPPILAYLAALTPPEIDVTVFDLSRQKVDYDEPVDLVCISCMTPMATQGEEVAREFKKRGIKVAMGGHHPTVRPLEVKEFADYVFIGEAENTYPKFIEDFKNDTTHDFYMCGEFEHTKNLPGKVYHLKERPDLKNLPIPRRELIKPKYRFDTIQTTRGCPYACDFCSVTEFFGNTMRTRPIEEIDKEIDHLGPLFMNLDDNCFGYPKENIEFFKTLINKKKTRKWIGSGSLSIVNHPKCDEILSLAAKSGLCFLMVGIESLDSETLKDNHISAKLGHKGEPDNEFTKRAIKKIQSYGIVVWGFMIFGFSDEKPDIFEKAYQFIRETHIVPCPAVLNILPETKLYHRLKDYAIPSRGYEANAGPLATFYINHLRPYELEDGVAQLQKKAYKVRNIFRRVIRTRPLLNMLVSVPIEFKMRKIYKGYFNIKDRYKLPDNEQLLASEFIQKTANKN